MLAISRESGNYKIYLISCILSSAINGFKHLYFNQIKPCKLADRASYNHDILIISTNELCDKHINGLEQDCSNSIANTVLHKAIDMIYFIPIPLHAAGSCVSLKNYNFVITFLRLISFEKFLARWLICIALIPYNLGLWSKVGVGACRPSIDVALQSHLYLALMTHELSGCQEYYHCNNSSVSWISGNYHMEINLTLYSMLQLWFNIRLW